MTSLLVQMELDAASRLREENTKLREELEQKSKLATPHDFIVEQRDHWKQRAEAAEQLLAAVTKERDEANDNFTALKNVLHDTQAQLAAANSRIAVLDAVNVQQAEELERLKEANSILSEELQATEGALKLSAKKYNQDIGVKDFVAATAQRQIEELTKLLAEERKKAVPEVLYDSAYIAGMKFGWDCCITGSQTEFNKAIAQRISDRVDYKAMLSAAPHPEDKP